MKIVERTFLSVTKSAMLLFLMAAISGCNGGGDGGGNGSGSSSSTTLNTASAISGTADKGIITGGTVTAYPVVNGKVDELNPLGSDTTDANGEYAITLPDSYNGEPLLIEITTDGSAMMKCDLPSGCGNSDSGPIAFGGDYPLTDTSFFLQAIIASAPINSVSVNITPLTNIAAELAQEILSGDFGAVQIAQANSQVADRFGITGDLTEFEVIDVTDPAKVAVARDAVVEYAAISAAIIEAVQNDNPGFSIEEAIRSFAADYALEGLAGNASDAETTDLKEILTVAQSVLNSVAALDEDNTLGLTALTSNLAAKALLAEQENPNIFDKGTPSETAFTVEIDQVKAFIAEWRDVAMTIGSSQVSGVSGVSGVSVEALATNFSDQIAASSLANSEETTEVLKYLAISILAIEQAYEAFEIDDTLTAFEFDPDLVVDIASNGTVLVLSINTIRPWGSINLNASLDASLTADVTNINSLFYNGQDISEIDGSLKLAVSGSLSNNAVELRISDGSSFFVESIDLSQTSSETESEYVGLDEPDYQYEATSTDAFTLSSIMLRLKVELEELTTPNPVTFEGMLEASIAGLDYSAEEKYLTTYSEISFSALDESQSSLKFSTVSLALGGEFSNTSGDRFSAAIAIQGDASGVTLSDFFTESLTCRYSYPFDCDWVNNESTTADETEKNFVALGFTLSFSADLANTLDTAAITLSAERSGFEAVAASFNVTYPSVQLSAEFNCAIVEEICSVELGNQDGVSAMIVTDTNGDISGKIKRGGKTYATIENRNFGTVIVYADGDFESL